MGWSSSARSARRRVRARQLHEEPDPERAPALLGIRPPAVPGHAGDVEVRPWHVAREAPQELPADDRGRLALLRRVVEVAVAALDQLGVLVVQRQAPQAL